MKNENAPSAHQPQLWATDVAAAAARCQAAYPQAAQAAVRRADEICGNTFLFREHWEMEQTSNPVHFDETVDWSHIPAGDPEWLYALNRHTIFLNLGKAWRYTGDPQYPHHFARLMQSWLAQVPLTTASKQDTWRSLEVGIRCGNWLRTLRLFENSPALTPALKAGMENSLLQHGEYLMEAYTDFHRLSNWGILQDHGLFLLGIYFNRAGWQQTALARMAENLHRAVMQDGTHWEQSPLYHCEVVHCAADTLWVARQNGVAVPPALEDATHRMLTALAKWLMPNGHILCQSDSDDVDARDLLAFGAFLFRDGYLRFAAGDGYYEENVWDIGPALLDAENPVQPTPPLCPSTLLPDSDNYMLRSDFSPQATFAHIHCGCLGGGHGHADLLHLDVQYGGENVLVDSGRYTYVGTPLRHRLKEPAAHNTLQLDDEPFGRAADSWAYAAVATPLKAEYAFTSTADYTSGAHLGYLHRGVVVQRKVVFVKPDILVLFDVLYGKGTHTATQYFHFGSGTLALQGNTAHWQGNTVAASVTVLQTAGLAVTQQPYSKHYNSLTQGPVLCVTTPVTGPAALITVLSLGGACRVTPLPVTATQGGEPLPGDKAQAVQLEKNGQKTVVVACHGESAPQVNLLHVGGYCGHGKVLVFTPQQPNGTCLAW
ncbi:MAG: heparinase II/III family protein [Gemmiger sp.]|nr:heparinase II/III family protein [Gemmiger sp.]